MRRIVDPMNRALLSRGAGVVLLICLAACYATAYFNHALFPGFDANGPARGWLTWTDQSRYLTESTAISRLQLDAASYFYPIGYPLLGAAFVKWLPNNAFLVPNTLLILGAACVLWRLALRWLNPILALGTGIVFVFTHSWLVSQTMIVPWNTIATQFTLLAGIAIVIGVVDSAAVLYLAILAAVTYIIRPIDAVAFAPLLVFATMRLPSWRSRIGRGIAGLAIIGTAVGAVGGLNLMLLGQWRTAYEIVSTETVGFFSYPVSYKLYWLLIDGSPLFGETDAALLFRYPWLFLSVPALIFLVQQEKAAGAAVMAAIGINVALYLNYNDLLPSDIYRFMLIHYLAWTFPLVFLLAVAACWRIRTHRWTQFGFGLSLVVLLVSVGLRLEPVKSKLTLDPGDTFALPSARPLLVEFPGVPMESIHHLRIDGRPLIEYSEYLVPYVPSNLKLLLGTRTAGTNLHVAPGAGFVTAPVFGQYEWQWKPVAERLNWFATRRLY